MQPHISVTPIWSDEDLLELRVAASNLNFFGSVELYAQHSALKDMAALLDGFPNVASDTRCISWGATGGGYAGGYAQMSFRCSDGAGHPVADVQLISRWTSDGVPVQSVKLSMAFEAASLDAFAANLSDLRPENRLGATLWGVV